MTIATIITTAAVRGGMDTTVGFYTDSAIERELRIAIGGAAGYKKWPFTEYMDKSGAFVAGTEGHAHSNTGLKTDSIRI